MSVTWIIVHTDAHWRKKRCRTELFFETNSKPCKKFRKNSWPLKNACYRLTSILWKFRRAFHGLIRNLWRFRIRFKIRNLYKFRTSHETFFSLLNLFRFHMAPFFFSALTRCLNGIWSTWRSLWVLYFRLEFHSLMKHFCSMHYTWELLYLVFYRYLTVFQQKNHIWLQIGSMFRTSRTKWFDLYKFPFVSAIIVFD